MSACVRTLAAVPWRGCWRLDVGRAGIDQPRQCSGRVSDAAGRRRARGHRSRPGRSRPTSSATAVTDGGGRFRFPYLRVGAYELMVQLAGFTEAHRRIALSVGSAFEMPFVLAVEGVAATPCRSGPRRRCSSRRAARSPPRSRSPRCESLPLNGRNFLDIALLAPGVAPPNINSTQLFAETSAVPGVGLSVGSQRNLSNSFIVDGLSANDDAAGLSGMPYGVDAVEQFQVVTSGGQAELGRALGGYVNVVTRSGTNQLRGTAYGYFRDDALNAPNALSGTTLPMSQQQYGASVGGPIRQGPHVLLRERRAAACSIRPGFTTISDANVATVNARLAAVGYPRPARSRPGNYRSPVDSLNVLGKVDHAFTGRDQLSVRYSLYDVASDELARRRRAERAVGIVGARQPRPGGRRSATR